MYACCIVLNEDSSYFWLLLCEFSPVELIVGTNVGPVMFVLPITTIKSGQILSIISILLTCVYVIYYINLVAGHSFEAIEKGRVDEVIFTSLDTNALGSKNGSFVKLAYGSITVSFLVACVSGIG